MSYKSSMESSVTGKALTSHIVLLPITLALLLVSACGTREVDLPQGESKAAASIDLAAVRSIIERKNAQFTAAHVAGDVAAIDAMFTRDAKSFPPGSEAAVGPAALHALTVEYLKSGIKAFTEQTTDLYGTSEVLIDQGEYSVTYGPDNTIERGKYLNVWKQEDGEWRIQANIWNTSPPTELGR
jgi:ketosteroid isomerase-like protein